jgi:Condensation domain/Phosphopantetheine attachment site
VRTTNVNDIYELSPLQRGMLLHSVHDGATDMYLGQHVYIVEGKLDVDALTQAWRRVFESHPALRTSFHWDGLDKPLQVVHRDVMPPADHQDWSDLPEDLQRERLDLLMAEDRATGFDLTSAPLQRLHLIRLGADRHALAWTYHHLLLDGWSVPIFMNEVVIHYESLTAGGPPPPPAPPFRDYIAWLQRQDMDAARTFWKETLSDLTPAHLVALRPLDPRRGTGAVERHVVSIASTLEDGLRDAAARHQVTLNAVLQAAWAAVLRRHTGSADVVFGCVSSGRPAELRDVDRMVGMFVNTLPVPVTVPEDGDMGQWLRDIQARHAAIRRYEFSPLSDIKKWAGLPGQQLFDSLFVLDNYSFLVEAGNSIEGQLVVRSQALYDKVSVPLAVIFTPAPVSQVHLVLHEDRFGAGFADSILGCLLATLRAITGAATIGQVLSAAGPLPDMARLPAGVSDGPGLSGTPLVPPATPDEEAIAAVYKDVLELTEIDVTASFFDLGGDSFGAIRAVGRIEGATVAMLALNPSVRDLAAALTAAGLGEADDGLDAEIAELERQLAEKTELERQLKEGAGTRQRLAGKQVQGVAWRHPPTA